MINEGRPELSPLADGGTDGGTRGTREALRMTGGPHFVLRRVVGAERFERSTS
jgi:hypothetical protein